MFYNFPRFCDQRVLGVMEDMRVGRAELSSTGIARYLGISDPGHCGYQRVPTEIDETNDLLRVAPLTQFISRSTNG